MMRRLLSFILTGSIILTLDGGMVCAEEFSQSDYEENVVSVLSTSVSAPIVVEEGQSQELDLGGGTISYGGGSVVTVKKGAMLTLKNGTVTGGSGTVSGANRQGGGIWIGEGATVILDNVKVTGNEATHGGGVYLSSGTLEMVNGSSITGNTVTVEGGGVNVNGGKLEMSGTSTISGNRSEVNGGGVRIGVGSIVMSGSSSIVNNTAVSRGGGVHLSGGTISLEGAVKVSGNTGFGKTQNITLTTYQEVIKVVGGLSGGQVGVSIGSTLGAYSAGAVGSGSSYTVTTEDVKCISSDATEYGILLANNVISIGVPEVEKYLVTFVDEFEADVSKSVESGKTVSSVNRSKEGYEFLGWFTDEKREKEFSFSTKITDDVSLYALWEKEEVEVVPETTVPETTVPETTVPETTVPETTVPETTVPETTVPETTVPESTVPETTVPESTVPESTVPETTVPETTVPETTVPEITVPESTVPESTVPETTVPEIEEDVEEELEEEVEEELEEEVEEELEEEVEEELEEEVEEELEEENEGNSGGYIPGVVNPEKPFVDVNPWDWFYEQVYHVFSTGLMAGTSETEFSPYVNTTRGMVATILYQLDGKPSVVELTDFPDVQGWEYYAVPVAWAVEYGVFAGYDDGFFRPNQQITREELALVLYRFTQKQGGKTGITGGVLLNFYDVASVSAFAWDGLSWAVTQGVMEGRTGNVIGAVDPATRSEMATMLTHLVRLV